MSCGAELNTAYEYKSGNSKLSCLEPQVGQASVAQRGGAGRPSGPPASRRRGRDKAMDKAKILTFMAIKTAPVRFNENT